MRAPEPRSIAAAAGLRPEALEHSVPTAHMCSVAGRYFLAGQWGGATAGVSG